MSWIGQVAYEAWASTGSGALGYQELTAREQARWDTVAQAVIQASSNTTGMTSGIHTADTLPPPPPVPTERVPERSEGEGDQEEAPGGNPSQKGE